MSSIPSIRQMWLLWKDLLIEGGFDRGDLILAEGILLCGARGVISALAFQAGRGRLEEIERAITRQGRQIKALMGLAPRKRRHWPGSASRPAP